MKTTKPLLQVAALLLTFAAVVPAKGVEQGLLGRTFSSSRVEIDPAIPEAYRRNFSTSRNQVVMVFQRTYWRSLTKSAAKGTYEQQVAFCDHLTRSDLATGKIPYGFRYETNGDGRVYLLKTSDYAVYSYNTVGMK